MSENVISVSQFSNYIKQIFMSEELLHNILIYGEISDIKVSRNIAYFNIKDEEALLVCVKFGIGDEEVLPKEGDLVLVRGSPNYYIKGGKFSFNVISIQPYGQGLLYQQFLEMKNKLEKEGLFKTEIKKPLPEIIKRVGVITSETGAVLHDIIDITKRRNPMIDIVVYPAKVQGIGAEQTIIDGLKALDTTNVDVIIIARGGGSLEDLSCFNQENIARAIFQTEKPVISAVGHETDYTIADFVSDLRAPTPSAAAELISIDIEGLKRRFLNVISKIDLFVQNELKNTTETLQSNAKQMILQTDVLTSQLEPNLREKANKMYTIVENMFINKENDVNLLISKIEKFNPLKILQMGYAKVSFKNNIIKNCDNINVGDNIDVEMRDAILNCEIKGKVVK